MAELELARHCNLLSDGSRFKRKRALETIKKETVDRFGEFETDVRISIFQSLCPSIVNSLNDEVEKHRETAISIIESFIDEIDNIDEYLGLLIPAITNRIGRDDFREPSEEIRYQLIGLCLKLIDKSSKNHLVPFIEDLIRIFIFCIGDPYHEVKKVTCQCASNLSKKAPEYFYHQSEYLIKPLCSSITHQHSRVRVEVVKAIGNVIQYGDNKFVDEVVSHLAQRLFDQAPTVRKAVIEVVGNWLLDLRDRYSFFHRLIPLILSGYSDDVAEIKDLTDQLWYDIGLRYERENESDFKDKEDYTKPAPSHYPPDIERPNLGCRGLIYRNLSRILPALARDLTDWVSGTRVKAAQLLLVLAINAEECMTQHMEVLLSAVYRAASDEEAECREAVEKSTEIIGYFVEPRIWWHLIGPTLTKADANLQRGVLSTLASILRGADPALMIELLPEIARRLIDKDVCHAYSVELKTQLCRCVESLLRFPPGLVKDTTTDLMILLHTIMGLQEKCDKQVAQAFSETCRSLISQLAVINGFEDSRALYQQELPKLLEILEAGAGGWTRHSPEAALLDCLLVEAGPEVGRCAGAVVPLLCACLDAEREVEFRMRFLLLLTRLLQCPGAGLDAHGLLSSHAVRLLADALLPNAVWRAGRTAEALRSAVLACLWALLLGMRGWEERAVEEGEMEVWEKLRAQLVSMMDEDVVESRRLATRCLRKTLQLRGTKMDRDELHRMYPAFLKRLDDADDEIRLKATHLLSVWIDILAPEYNVSLYKGHLEDLYRGLLVHLDDPEAPIQEAVLGVLSKAGALCPEVLATEMQTARAKCRPETRTLCDQLLQQVSSS